MRRFLIGCVILALIGSVCRGDDISPKRWQSVVLWSDSVVSAKLYFLLQASLADEACMFLQLDNRSGNTLTVRQGWLNVEGTRMDAASGKILSTGGITGGVFYYGGLSPGITSVTGFVFTCASENLGLPRNGELRVAAVARGDVRLDDGRVFAGSTNFNFEWRSPNPTEIESMKRRLKALLAHPEYKFEHGSRLRALIQVEEVADATMLDELLPALKSRQNSVDGRFVVENEIGRRFVGHPMVVSYFQERLDQDDKTVLWDLQASSIWNQVWVSALVTRFERAGAGEVLTILSRHRSDWATNSAIVSRLSSAFLRHRPFFKEPTTQLGTNQLYDWCGAAYETSIIGDKKLIPFLRSALEDERIAQHPHENELAYQPMRQRVCDAALLAILGILDGDPNIFYKQTGLAAGFRENENKERIAVNDRIIMLLKKRLESETGLNTTER